MTQENEGIDTSFWKRGLNYSLVRAAGKTFTYNKASEGTFVDPSYAQHREDSKQQGLLGGAFHYFRATMNPLLQAQTFLGAVIQGDINSGMCELLPAIDVEYNPGIGHDDDLLVPPSEWASRLKIMVNYIKKETGLDSIFYTSLYYWRRLVDPTGEQLWARNHGLWIAQWDVPKPDPLPKPFIGYIFHQYGVCKIDGMEIDANRFHGDNIWDYAQMLHIGRTREISGEIEEKRESWRRYAALKDAQLEQYDKLKGEG